MAKVLRLQNDGNNNLQHWQDSNAYGKTAISGIIDGNGDAVSRQITSIPSPFARFDLLKVAFEFVNNSKNINGNTIYHKMVSDCLDIAELFYDFDKFSADFDIIAWDIDTNLKTLCESSDLGHKQLGDTLKLFFQQDAKANNFDKVSQIFLLDYKKGSHKTNIIGGTSPVTLFSTTANNYDGQIDVFFGNRRMFQGVCPLNQRQFGFQEYMYALMASIPSGNILFATIYDYLNNINFPLLDNEQKSTIKGIDSNTIKGNSYQTIHVGGGNNVVETLRFPIYSFKVNVGSIQDNSGFVIEPNIPVSINQLPLVLPIDKVTNNLMYVTASWDKNKVAPFYDNNDLDNRILPHDGSQYPYYTISDFLEENIVCVPFPINSEAFFSGVSEKKRHESERGYLLPIKPEFFKYFSYDFLEKEINGKKTLEITERGDGDTLYVDVSLRIPIKGDGSGNTLITYQRTYVTGGKFNSQQADLNKNKGAIFNYSFSVALTSLVKYQGKNDNGFYRIGFFDNDTVNSVNNSVASLDVFRRGKRVEPTAIKKRQINNAANSTYYVIEDTFDIIQLKVRNVRGVILPRWVEKIAGNVKFSFAVDFGTTNTHIEYKSTAQPIATPFDITSKDVQLVKLHKLSENQISSLEYRGFENVFYQELMPTLINKDVTDFFPQRTVLTHHINMNFVDKNYALADYNIPFYYEKNVVIGDVNTLHTNLKWTNFGSNQNAQSLVTGYLENLMFLMYNKVILNGGDTSDVKIKWLYPTSMSRFNLTQLTSTWSELYQKYFGEEESNLEEVTEALAPYNYYITQGVQSMSNSVVSVDIGGGTTDVVVFTNNQPQILTSFKFAANNLFGDAINTTSNLNGYVEKYRTIYDGLLDRKYKDIGDSILVKGNSSDYISFLFSLEKDTKFNSNHAFTKLLNSDVELKVAPLIFFSSIIYYIANMMKAKQVISPQYFTFSGTGSKLINILDTSSQKQVISSLISEIFRDIYNDSNINVQVRIDSQVKEISCKGALSDNPQRVEPLEMKKIKSIYEFKEVDGKETIYSEVEKPEYISNIHSEYTRFIDWFFAFDKKFGYEDNFGISAGALSLYKTNLLQNSLGFLKLELEASIKNQNGNKESALDETLFFYPLKGTINQLLFAIASGNLK
ncbi:hypothetical protein [Myroides marinus]|uniref:hypothetical protein n=2 Tax=Pseudomonadati TaxID=3379134 RepID=UPI0025783912|nr:hypothetical protein [Myroides marinus]MDM1376347.1 hypothetical protein [Myroides marinus]MDM1382059.1 hypothetical protein [Myroides marinus]